MTPDSITAARLARQAALWLDTLCTGIDSRRVGSAGNRAATDFFARTAASFGFEVQQPAFECIDWAEHGVELRAGDALFEAQASPYSLGCDVRGPLAVVSSVAELVSADLRGKVLLLRDEIAREQLMPKNFTFYNPEEHQRIIALLEEKEPLAIIAATGRNPELAGGLYPFPLIEDGDFDIPSVCMTDVEGRRLAQHAGQAVALNSRAERILSSGCNVVARKGDMARWVVFFAHIDAKPGTPGALDNATGVVILLLLAELLADGYGGAPGIEIVALNGEDYYAASGEMLWLRENDGRMHEIMLGVNMDGVGYQEGRTAWSLYGCPPDMEQMLRELLAIRSGMAEGDPWYQSDHSLFVFNNVPALAFTSDHFSALWTEVAHTPRDTPELVAPERLVEVASALREFLAAL
ncbi:MAG: M28 family peptidase [Caldilineales bacterium]